MNEFLRPILDEAFLANFKLVYNLLESDSIFNSQENELGTGSLGAVAMLATKLISGNSRDRLSWRGLCRSAFEETKEARNILRSQFPGWAEAIIFDPQALVELASKPSGDSEPLRMFIVASWKNYYDGLFNKEGETVMRMGIKRIGTDVVAELNDYILTLTDAPANEFCQRFVTEPETRGKVFGMAWEVVKQFIVSDISFETNDIEKLTVPIAVFMRSMASRD